MSTMRPERQRGTLTAHEWHRCRLPRTLASQHAHRRLLLLPSRVVMAPYRSGRRSRNMPQLQQQQGRRAGKGQASSARPPLRKHIAKQPTDSPRSAVTCPQARMRCPSGPRSALPYPARLWRQSSRSNEAVTKPSSCSGEGSMPPLACAPRAPACGTRGSMRRRLAGSRGRRAAGSQTATAAGASCQGSAPPAALPCPPHGPAAAAAAALQRQYRSGGGGSTAAAEAPAPRCRRRAP